MDNYLKISKNVGLCQEIKWPGCGELPVCGCPGCFWELWRQGRNWGVRDGIDVTVSSTFCWSSSPRLCLQAEAVHHGVPASPRGVSFAVLIITGRLSASAPPQMAIPPSASEVTSLCKIGQVTVQGGLQPLSSREAFPEGLGLLERPGQAKDGPGNPRWAGVGGGLEEREVTRDRQHLKMEALD